MPLIESVLKNINVRWMAKFNKFREMYPKPALKAKCLRIFEELQKGVNQTAEHCEDEKPSELPLDYLEKPEITNVDIVYYILFKSRRRPRLNRSTKSAIPGWSVADVRKALGYIRQQWDLPGYLCISRTLLKNSTIEEFSLAFLKGQYQKRCKKKK